MWVRYLGLEDPLKKEMATHSRKQTEETGILSMESQTVGHDLTMKQQKIGLHSSFIFLFIKRTWLFSFFFVNFTYIFAWLHHTAWGTLVP